jgi:hypothetical protein
MDQQRLRQVAIDRSSGYRCVTVVPIQPCYTPVTAQRVDRLGRLEPA